MIKPFALGIVLIAATSISELFITVEFARSVTWHYSELIVMYIILLGGVNSFSAKSYARTAGTVETMQGHLRNYIRQVILIIMNASSTR